MNFISQQIPYQKTGAFSTLVTDYLSDNNDLKNFYAHQPNLDGVSAAILDRKKYSTNRKLLVEYFKEQYQNAPTSKLQQNNIDLLLNENTFTVTTAHQPNIFTGHLYFIYKILHAIKLANDLSEKLTAYKFVPVYYMGSEDADLQELGEIVINGSNYRWETNQTGAVGRMTIDKAFEKIIEAIGGQLSVEPFGEEILQKVKETYSFGKTIQQATFEFVNLLFKDFGLLILIPDNAKLKAAFEPIVHKELTTQFSHAALQKTTAIFPEKYKLQTTGRMINLFYLKDNVRERIEQSAEGFSIANTKLSFTESGLFQELKTNPELVSPNVILRPVFQEMILPNIAFIGGGGELAYWLELKGVFDAVAVPYPVLILRNSFSIIPAKIAKKINDLGFSEQDFFEKEQQLVNDLVTRESAVKLRFGEERLTIIRLYKEMRLTASAVDITLEKHVWALQSQVLQKLDGLEKKMLKSARKKFEVQIGKIKKVKQAFYPNGNLQERVDNFLPYYSKYGPDFIKMLYQNSEAFSQQFHILTEVK